MDLISGSVPGADSGSDTRSEGVANFYDKPLPPSPPQEEEDEEQANAGGFNAAELNVESKFGREAMQ